MFVIDDNFLSSDEVESFHKSLITDHNRRWTITPLVSYEDDNSLYDLFKSYNWRAASGYQVVSMVTPTDPKDEVSRTAARIFKKFCQKHNVNFTAVKRGKFNITWNAETDLVSPHIDGEYPHWVFLYYINDSDGDTIFYDRTWSPDLEWGEMHPEFAVSPKAGRGVLFNGWKFHSPSAPSAGNTRLVLNVTFVDN